MKTRAYLLAILLLFVSAGLLQAQSSRNTVDDRVEKVMSKFDSALKLEKADRATVSEIFTDFYTAQDKLRDNIQRPASSLAQGLTQSFARQDYQSVRKQNDKIVEDRDARLKKVLTSDQYKKWTDEIEPSLRTKK